MAARFGEQGIRWMALKGAALAVRHYRDLGLRSMTDLDILVHPADLERAIGVLSLTGYRAEEDDTADAIVRQARVRHACQFFRGAGLEPRPALAVGEPLLLSRSNAVVLGRGGPYAAEATACWRHRHRTSYFTCASMACNGTGHGRSVGSPMPSQFYVSRWTGSASGRTSPGGPKYLPPGRCAGVVAGEVWGAGSAGYVRAPDPGRGGMGTPCVPLAPKPCPLGVSESLAWHAHHFRRIRPFDDRWRHLSLATACPQYLLAFLDAPSLRSLWLKLRPHLLLRLRRVTRRSSVGSGAHS